MNIHKYSNRHISYDCLHSFALQINFTNIELFQTNNNIVIILKLLIINSINTIRFLKYIYKNYITYR